MNYIQERQEELRKNLLGSYSDSSIQALSAAEFIEKGKKANLGETRDWGGKKYQKTVNGWIPYAENGGKVKAHEEEKPSKVVMNKEIMDGLDKLGIDKEKFSELKSHYGSAEKLHAAVGNALAGEGDLEKIASGDKSSKSPVTEESIKEEYGKKVKESGNKMSKDLEAVNSKKNDVQAKLDQKMKEHDQVENKIHDDYSEGKLSVEEAKKLNKENYEGYKKAFEEHKSEMDSLHEEYKKVYEEGTARTEAIMEEGSEKLNKIKEKSKSTDSAGGDIKIGKKLTWQGRPAEVVGGMKGNWSIRATLANGEPHFIYNNSEKDIETHFK